MNQMPSAFPLIVSCDDQQYQAVIVPTNDELTSFDLYVDGTWVAVLKKECSWTMDGKFVVLSSFFYEFIEKYILTLAWKWADAPAIPFTPKKVSRS